MKTVILTIGGMQCDGCVETVRDILLSQKGVESSTVSLASQEARVVYDPASIDPDRLIFAVERAGYTAAQMGA